MADIEQLTTVLNRLRQVSAAMAPAVMFAELVELIAEAIEACGEPPRGNPDELITVGRAWRTAAEKLDEVGAHVAAMGSQTMPPVWVGVAASNASEAVAAVATHLRYSPQFLSLASTSLGRLSDELRESQRVHAEGKAMLTSSKEQIMHPRWRFPGAGNIDLPVPDLSQLGQILSEAMTGVMRCLAAYELAETAAQEARTRFRNISGEARAGDVQGRSTLSTLDLVVLSAQLTGDNSLGEFDNGILNPGQLQRASQRFDALSPQEREEFQRLLEQAKSPQERSYLMKALAAGHDLRTIQRFAGLISGRPPEWLDRHLNLAGSGSTGQLSYTDSHGKTISINQTDQTTCGSMSILMLRAMNDPVYAFALTTGYRPDAADADSADAVGQRLSREQQRIHDSSTAGELLPFPGMPDYPQFVGTPPWGVAHELNRYSAATGVTYDWSMVDDTDPEGVRNALEQVTRAVDAGHPVPLYVGDSVPRHIVLVVGHDGNRLLVYEPSAGRTATVTVEDFIHGTMGAVGFNHVQFVVTPRD